MPAVPFTMKRIRRDTDRPRKRPHLPELRLRHAIPYSIAGQLAYVTSQMGVLSALAHFRGAAAVGEFGLALALTTPAFMFVNMAGKSSQASDVNKHYSFAEYGGLVASAAVFAALISVAAGLIFAQSRSALLIIVVIAATKLVESISTLAYGAFQQSGRVDKVALSMGFRGLFTAALFAVLLWLGFTTAFAFFAQLMVWSVMAVGRDYPLASQMMEGRFVWPSGNWPRIWRLARETAPLGGSYVVSALLVSLPRMFVERSLGMSAVGLLTVASYFQQAGSMLFSAMSLTIVNRVARLRQRSNERALHRTLLGLLAFVGICSAIGLALAVIAGKWLLVVVFGPEFAAASGLLILVAVALCIRLFGVIPQSLLHAERRFTTFFVRELVTVIACAALLALFIPRWGLLGAGYAIVGAAAFRLFVMCLATTIWRTEPKRAQDQASAAGDREASA